MGFAFGFGIALIAAEGSAAGSPPWKTGCPGADPIPGEGGASRLAAVRPERAPACTAAAATAQEAATAT
eukprot:11414925-Alexandrium_andersonii.AAC.1